MSQNAVSQKNLKSVVVLAAAPGRLHETERFLTNRGWRVSMTSDLKAFLADITWKKPRYALVSVDYGHANLEKIRPLVEKIYKTILIEFAEEPKTASWARLDSTRGGFKIFGELSGPAFERFVARMHPLVSSRKEAEDLLRRGSVKALNRVFPESDAVVRKPVGWCSRLTCVQVKTKVLSGHFVVAVGGDRALDESLAAALRDSLIEMMKSCGFEIDMADAFPMEVRRVEFKRWALKAATLLERSIHEGNEISMAFFPGEEDIFALGASEDENMVSIAVDEITSEASLDFELYLHLPLNKKFVLYVTRGGQLSLRQQLGLQARGVSSLHIKKKDAASIFRERAHRHFDRSIANFYEAGAVAA